jgi:hypothetical protein
LFQRVAEKRMIVRNDDMMRGHRLCSHTGPGCRSLLMLFPFCMTAACSGRIGSTLLLLSHT